MTEVALYGLFGCGNLGNDASLGVVLHHLQNEFPGVSFTAVCDDPDGIALPPNVGTARISTRHGSARGRLPVRALRAGTGRLADAGHTLSLLRRFDAVVVPGMGVFEDTLGAAPWGMAYLLLLLAVLGKLTRTPVLFVAVGATVPRNPLTRRMFALTLRLAAYRSYRDEISRAAAVRMGVADQPESVFADVAFALDEAPRPAVPPGERPIVGIGTLAWYGPDNDPATGRQVHEDYVAEIGELVHRLAGRAVAVRFVVGDAVDAAVARQATARVLAADPSLAPLLEIPEPARDLATLMDQLAPCAVVVASRYHNQVAALLLGKPVVGLQYAEKSTELLTRAGSAHIHDLRRWEAAGVLADVTALLAARPAAAPGEQHLQRLATCARRVLADLSRHLAAVAPVESPRVELSGVAATGG